MDQENELSLGEYLKSSREKANYSIEKLSLKTRINATILRSLEAEDFKSLPNPAYLKGFVLNYVKMFSLDENEAIKLLEVSYHKNTGQPFPSLNRGQNPQSTFKKTAKDTDQLLNKTESVIDKTKTIMPFVIAAIVIAASFGGYKLVSNMINKEASLSRGDAENTSETIIEDVETANEPQETTTTAEPTPPEKTEMEKPTENDVSEVATTPAPQPPVVEEKPAPQPAVPEKKVETKKKQDTKQRNFPTIEFKDISKNLYTLKPNAPENKDDSLMPASYKAKLDPEKQNLYIHALEGETWVSYKVDDEPIQNEFIRQGKALFLQGNEIRMFFGNINVTRIFLNNVFIDATSKTGVKTIVFPESAASKYKRPLFPRSASGELYTSEE
ncbi:MAG: helix-turn-helix domain-containing protein, partial [Candidatus Caldatribacteriota bacterium]